MAQGIDSDNSVRKERYTYEVSIDRDQVPGFNHQPEDMETILQGLLDEQIPHYNPTVMFIKPRDIEIVNEPENVFEHLRSDNE